MPDALPDAGVALNPNRRAIVSAISLAGASIRQASEPFNMSKATIRVALHRALKSLVALYRKGESS